MRWTDVSPDPNSPAALHYRQEQLGKSRRLHDSVRHEFYRDLCRGQRVLDIGCVDHDFDLRNREWWLHDILRSSAASVVGVDYDQTGIAKMQQAGYDAICADVTGDLSAVLARGPFDVVVAGEIIEHVQSPQSVLELAPPLLANEGVLVVTTPNPFAPWRVRAGQRGEVWENVDHVCYLFPSGMAELADRAGMRLIAYGTWNITGRTSSLRGSLRELLGSTRRSWRDGALVNRLRQKRLPVSPLWVSPADALLMKLRSGPMLGEDAVYVLQVG